MDIKRLFDIIFSGGFIILTLPIMILIYFLIKIDSAGQSIFKQERVGIDRRRNNFASAGTNIKAHDKRKVDLGGRPFVMYKFRSMVQDAEEMLPSLVNISDLPEPVYKIKNDPRITFLGHFLRKSSLDELPQLFNVLRGDMSLVGPRPEAKRVVYHYNEKHKKRLQVKPGITGLQQVMCRGTKSMRDRLRCDLYYVRRNSLILDFWILLRTVFVVLFMRGNH